MNPNKPLGTLRNPNKETLNYNKEPKIRYHNNKKPWLASVAGAVIQAIGRPEFEDGLRTGVLQEDC